MFETNVFSTSPPMLQGDIVGATDHTPDENEFQMTIIPSARIIFMGDDVGKKPVTVYAVICNNTSLTQAFKVKCTANKMFIIRPAYGIIAPKQSQCIKITFKWKDVPEDDLHFISFYHIRFNKVVCNLQPREIFEKYKPEGVKRIQCQFKNASGQPIHLAHPKSTTKSVVGGSSATHSVT